MCNRHLWITKANHVVDTVLATVFRQNPASIHCVFVDYSNQQLPYYTKVALSDELFPVYSLCSFLDLANYLNLLFTCH